MDTAWEERVEALWASAGRVAPDALLSAMEELVAQRPDGDPDATFEWASAHDFLGKEAEAVPLYRLALDRGLSGPRRPQCVIQLASSLRNVGELDAAISLLQECGADETTGDAAQAFLALVLFDAARYDDALRVALVALAKTLPLYSGVIERYASELVAPVR